MAEQKQKEQRELESTKKLNAAELFMNIIFSEN